MCVDNGHVNHNEEEKLTFQTGMLSGIGVKKLNGERGR